MALPLKHAGSKGSKNPPSLETSFLFRDESIFVKSVVKHIYGTPLWIEPLGTPLNHTFKVIAYYNQLHILHAQDLLFFEQKYSKHIINIPLKQGWQKFTDTPGKSKNKRNIKLLVVTLANYVSSRSLGLILHHAILVDITLLIRILLRVLLTLLSL